MAPAASQEIPPPDADSFYQQPAAAELEARKPGAVMRSREVTTVLVPLTPYPGERPLASFHVLR